MKIGILKHYKTDSTSIIKYIVEYKNQSIKLVDIYYNKLGYTNKDIIYITNQNIIDIYEGNYLNMEVVI